VLKTKGVKFGKILAHKDGSFNTRKLEGIDEDCVVRPFGRKGEFATVREFDIGAMKFHFGMQPVEEIGHGVDGDGDGVADEILAGELSALHIWATTLPKCIIEEITPKTLSGFRIFKQIGCASCHNPFLITKSRRLTYSFPEIQTEPDKNIYFQIDLVETANFTLSPMGGVIVPLFSDLKRHDMGDELAETFHRADPSSNFNREFITARLWGVADTAPYLHDGRATTITDAIIAHGGEAIKSRSRFLGLRPDRKEKLLAFLYSLHTPLEEEVGFERDLLFADD
jgi:hypothetical protein